MMMDEEQSERLVQAFERIAHALEGLHEQTKQAGARYWPEQRIQREAILSRVESDEERSIKQQGARRRTVQEIINPEAEESDEEYGDIIGERERQWYKTHSQATQKSDASGKNTESREPSAGSSQEAEG